MAVFIQTYGDPPPKREVPPAPPPAVSVQAPKVQGLPASIPLPPIDPRERLPKVDIETVDAYLCKIYLAAKKFDAGEDFSWKDAAAALQRLFRLPMQPHDLCEYAVGGMDQSFRQKLYAACKAAEVDGHRCGITSGYRGYFRQLIAIGYTAPPGLSWHGGSRNGGYGRGIAADIVSLDGRNADLYRWIDKHGKRFEIARPYGDRDPPHVTPLNSPEHIAKRGSTPKAASTKKAQPKQNKQQVAAH